MLRTAVFIHSYLNLLTKSLPACSLSVTSHPLSCPLCSTWSWAQSYEEGLNVTRSEVSPVLMAKAMVLRRTPAGQEDICSI